MTRTDLTTTATTKLEKSLGQSSLDAFADGERRSLLLVDCSSSMDAKLTSGERAIDAMRSVVKDLRDTHPVPVAAFYTAGSMGQTQVHIVDRVPEPQGMTPLAEAIDYAREVGATHLVVVTDGSPDSQTEAFAAATRFGHPIDVFYIGDGHDDGARFAKRLAKMTGGGANVTDLGKEQKQLAGKIAGLLGEGTPEPAKSAIQL